MLNELIKTVAKKANIPELAAQVAVNTVVTALKSKLPAALSGTLDTFLGTTATPKTTTTAKKTTTTTAKKTTATAKKTTTAKKGTTNAGSIDLGTIAGALGGLLGKK